MTADAARGDVITFYSYKGGTGRSMALANIAYLLAQRVLPKPVLAIDWDLEAPGLHRYLDPFLPGAAEGDQGLIDLFEEINQKRLQAMTSDREALAQQLVDGIDFKHYVRQTSQRGLSFLRAGHFDSEYAQRVNEFGWKAFYQAVPDFFRLFAERLAREYSYVLIDSRTGVTDISGICTMLMPNKLVVVFTPNRQSLTGITSLVKRAKEYRDTSDDSRRLVVFPLPSRIDTNYPDLMKLWREGNVDQRLVGWQREFEKILRDVFDLDRMETAALERYFDDVQIFHVSQYAFGEPIAAIDQRATDKATVTNSYVKLIDYLDSGAPWIAEVSQTRGAVLHWWFLFIRSIFRDVWRNVWLLARIAAAIIAAVLAGWYIVYGRAENTNSALLAQILKLDEEQIPSSTRALLLAETLPRLRRADHDVAFSKLEQTLALMPRNVIRWDAPRRIKQAAFSADGRYVVCVTEGAISIWRTEDGKKINEWPANVSQAVFYGKRADTLVTVGDDGLALWTGKTQEKRWSDFSQDTYLTVLSGDGNFAAAFSSVPIPLSLMRFFSLDSLLKGELTLLYAVQSERLSLRTYPKFLPGNSIAVVWNFAGAIVIDLASKRDIRIEQSGPAYTSGAISDDGKVVALATANRTVLYRGDKRTVEINIDANVSDLALAPNANTVVVAGTDGAIRSMDQTGRTIAKESFKPGETPTAVHALPDGTFLLAYKSEAMVVSSALSVRARVEAPKDLSGTFTDQATHYLAVIGATTMTIWDIGRLFGGPVVATSDDALIKLTCARAGRPLTKEEWATYLPNRDYDPQCKAPTLAN